MQNLTLNGSSTYDPFSRYAPFRVEARLDQIILKAVVKTHRDETDVQVTRKKLRSDKGPSKPLTAAPRANFLTSLSTSYSSAVDTAVPRSIDAIFRNPFPLPMPGLFAVASHPAFQPSGSVISDVPGLSPGTIQQWDRVAAGANVVEVHGVMVHSPILLPHDGEEPTPYQTASRSSVSFASFTSDLARGSLSALHTTIPSPPLEGFTLKGEVDLFGIPDLKASFYSWNGIVPSGVVVRVDKPIHDKAIISGDSKLSSILPILESTPFGNLPFRDVMFTYQNCVFEVTKAIGWHIDADFIVDASYGPLYDLLRTVLSIQEPNIHLHAGLGLRQNWGSSLALSSFSLDGSFPSVQAKICDSLTLTSVGVELLGISRMEVAPEPRSVMDFGFGVFGTLNLDIPGSTMPLSLSYKICDIGGLLQLCADLDGDIWTDPFGIEGLRVCLSSRLSSAER
jgi:hypothetical protein